MAVRSPIINVMAGAALKAARGLRRDFGEVEQLQVSIKGAGEWRRFGTETIRVAAGRIFGYDRLDRHREVERLVPGLATLCPPLRRPERRRKGTHSGVV